MKKDEIGERTKEFVGEATLLLEKHRYFEVTGWKGGECFRDKYTTSSDAYSRYNNLIDRGDSKVGIIVKTNTFQFRNRVLPPRGASVLSLENGDSSVRNVNVSFKTVSDFNQNFLVTLTNIFLEDFEGNERELARAFAETLIATITD